MFNGIIINLPAYFFCPISNDTHRFSIQLHIHTITLLTFFDIINDMSTSPEIEKLFSKYMENIGENPGGFIGFLKPENFENGDPKTLGKTVQRGANLLENSVNYMDFEPWELEQGRNGARLKEAVQIYREMGEEIEKMTEKEPREYHLYIIAMLIDIISSLLHHIENRDEK